MCIIKSIQQRKRGGGENAWENWKIQQLVTELN